MQCTSAGPSQDHGIFGDELMEHSPWHKLPRAALLQDPLFEVRQRFSKKIHRIVQDLQKDASAGHRAAKWAAVLPLAAMDPSEANCTAAFAFLMEYVAHRR